MKKQFSKIKKDTLGLVKLVSEKKFDGMTEDDLDILAESIDMLNDMYEVLYDNVFYTEEKE